jgi:cyclophilin family peptidyl-prolyl cis-trans isomerase
MSRKKRSNKLLYVIGSAGWLLLIVALGRFWYMTAAGPNSPASRQLTVNTDEGRVSVAKIEVGPFDIHRKYRSMEGPFVDQTFTIADLVKSGQIKLPESMVRWVENGSQASMTASGSKTEKSSSTPEGLVYADINKKELYWFKGIKLQVLDENDKILPTAEFICHMNLDVDRDIRNGAFADGEKVSNTRLITLTQGQTEFKFPEGYGVPVASFEPFRFTFQAANRTSDVHRRLKHLCTIEFIKDSDLKKPMVALAWYAPYIAVNINKTPDALKPDHEMNGPSCLGTNTFGENAPNSVNGWVFKSMHGEHLVGHWAIPPGVHTYSSPVTEERDRGFSDQDRVVHCVWSHIHPMCDELTLNICDGASKKPVWTVHSNTDTSHGLEIKHIDDIYSSQGIVLPRGKHYELTAKYSNVTGKPQDSMVVQGIFYEDTKFVKPFFLPSELASKLAKSRATGSTAAKPECNSLYCGVKPPEAEAAVASDYGGTDVYPLFDKNTDGPILKDAHHVKVKTSAGNINLTLDPALAPEAATQIYRLFQAGAYGGSTLCRYDPGYFLQFGSADLKRNIDYRLPKSTSNLLRRLPVEADAQAKGQGLHKKWALDLTRNKAKDSAVSSFTIMLADEPHLDHDFTVFGHVDQDAETMATIKKITSHWDATKVPYLMGASDKKSNWETAALPESINASPGKIAVAANAIPAAAIATATTALADHVSTNIAARSSDFPETVPRFNTKVDGPLLTSSKALTMQTSEGNIHIVLEPALAPINATQMYSLFKAGAFTNTTISRYDPEFVLQTDVADRKKNSTDRLNNKIKQMLRRLPLEVACHDKGQGLHKKYRLSMAHSDADPNSAVTSFSIVLGDSPHLDHKYTVFGHVVQDSESLATLDKITESWSEQHPFVVSVKLEPNKIASK